MIDQLIHLIHFITAGFITFYVVMVPVLDRLQSKHDINSTAYNQQVNQFYLLHKITLWAGSLSLLSGVYSGYKGVVQFDVWLILKLMLFILLFLLINLSTGKALRLRIKAYNRPWSRVELINKSKNKMSNLKYLNIIVLTLILLISVLIPL